MLEIFTLQQRQVPQPTETLHTVGWKILAKDQEVNYKHRKSCTPSVP
jgi:hypothetical protein